MSDAISSTPLSSLRRMSEAPRVSPTALSPTRRMSEALSPTSRTPLRLFSEQSRSLTVGPLNQEPRSPRTPKPFVEEDYRDAFDMFDEDKDGLLSRQELEKILKNMYKETTDVEIDHIMKAADTDGDGFINFVEFAGLLRDFVPRGDDAEVIRQAFLLIDVDGAGRFNSRKLKRFMLSLGAKTTDAYVEDVVRELDTNGDGEVEYPDFLKAMK